MDKVVYLPVAVKQMYQMPITGGTITQAKVGSYYNLTAAQVVNGASESATVGQLRLDDFISATRGNFTIVNL